MWAALVVAGVALAGTAFMLRFLFALLREGAPSVCYWVVPVRRGSVREGLEGLDGGDVGDNWWAVYGQTSVAQDEFPATKAAGIPVRRLRQLPWEPDIVRQRIGPPWQS